MDALEKLNPTVKLALVLGAAVALYKYAPHPLVKGFAVTVGSMAIAARLPVVNDVV